MAKKDDNTPATTDQTPVATEQAPVATGMVKVKLGANATTGRLSVGGSTITATEVGEVPAERFDELAAQYGIEKAE